MADRTRSHRSLFGTFVSMVTIALLLASCGGSSGDSSAGNGNDGGSEEAPVNEAQALFIEVGCAECHGEQGEGVEGSARSLQGTRTIIDQFSTRVRNGRGQAMPAYTADEISDEQIVMIHEWLASQ